MNRLLPHGALAAALLAMMTLAACANTHRATIAQPPPIQGQSLPVEFVYNLPVIDGSIGGEPLRLIVDLGGHDALALKQSAADRVPTITRTSARQTSFNAAGKMTVDRGLVAPELKLGDLVATDVHGRELELPPQLESRVDGYVGAALLRHFRLLVDYPARMVLYPPDGSPPGLDLAAWTPVRFDDRLRTTGAIRGRPIILSWDTGASHTVIDNDLAQELFGAAAGSLTSDIALDGHVFPAVELRVTELKGSRVELLVGHNFFQRHRVLFDFTARVALVEPLRPPQ